jgi:hypothetical protein
MAKIHEFPWEFLLQLQFHLEPVGISSQVDNVAITH